MTTKIQKKNAFAKLNLILKVLNKRQDNYHNIFSLFHKIDLCDIITVEPSDKLQIQCDTDLGINENDNIVYKAAAALNSHIRANHTAKLTINKNIPTGAGLGGGSSNAASTLLLLNKYWNLNLSVQTLHSIASSLGSDVPFFLADSPQWVYGRGELMQNLTTFSKPQYPHKNGRLQPIVSITSKYYVLVWPNISSSTNLAYQKLNRSMYELDINGFASKHIEEYTQKLNDNLDFFLPQIMQNDFEESVFEMYPDIRKIYYKLSAYSNGMARLTGSGSAVFALYKSQLEAEVAQYNMIKDFPNLNYKFFSGKLIK